MREITEHVELCLPDGRLNPQAVGWSRRPLHRTALPGWGRTKRWEYWCVMTPDHLIAVTVSSLDFLALNSVYFAEYGRTPLTSESLIPFALGTTLPESLGDGPAIGAGRPRIVIVDEGRLVRITVSGKIEADLTVRRSDGHETLNVVVPWDERRFQFTSKQTALPATGSVRAGGGRWTVGTGSTENAVCIDGRITVFPDEVQWCYDAADDEAPWTVRGPGVDLWFTPFLPRRVRAETPLIGNRTVQQFGHYSGTVTPESGRAVAIDGLRGWAEEVRMRW